MTESRVANLVIVGVPKAGTGSLFAYLAQHPDVCGSDEKEIGYFNHYSPWRRMGPPPPIEEGQIHVVVENGVAKLSGHVEFKSQIPRIVTMARTVDGVVDVESRLEHEFDDIGHERPSPPWDRARAGVGDSWRSPDA